jgi:hypothetical protein
MSGLAAGMHVAFMAQVGVGLRSPGISRKISATKSGGAVWIA